MHSNTYVSVHPFPRARGGKTKLPRTGRSHFPRKIIWVGIRRVVSSHPDFSRTDLDIPVCMTRSSFSDAQQLQRASPPRPIDLRNIPRKVSHPLCFHSSPSLRALISLWRAPTLGASRGMLQRRISAVTSATATDTAALVL